MATTETTTPMYSQALDAALALAAEAFRSEQRNDKRIPYLTHLLAVSALVGEYGGTEEEMIVGLLHDVLEDTPIPEKDLEAQFGAEVARMVKKLSDTTQEEQNGGVKPPWRPRKERYIQHLAGADGGVKLVCAADKLNNAQGLLRSLRLEGPKAWGHFRAEPSEQIWFFRAVLKALKQGWQHSILAELEEAVDKLVQAEASDPAGALLAWEKGPRKQGEDPQSD